MDFPNSGKTSDLFSDVKKCRWKFIHFYRENPNAF